MTLAPGGDRLNVALCTREFPPDGYGGAGVHVGYLAKELSNYVNLTVECQGADRSTAVAHQPWIGCRTPTLRCQTSSTELSMVADMNNADLVHSHTWYANTVGHLAALLYDIPHVMTVHSLEPLRPWKAEQLGGGYALSVLGRTHRRGERRCRHRGIGSHEGRRAVNLSNGGP